MKAEARAILVTGGCGFIGGHFVRHLLQHRPGWRVINLDALTYAGRAADVPNAEQDGRYRFVRGSITDDRLLHELLRAEEPWAIVNFAAESHVDRSILDPAPFLASNVLGVQEILAAVRRHSTARFLQISTDEVYGDVDGLEPCDEEAPLRPSNPYAASKAAADLLCLAHRRTYGLPVLVVRSANNYGPSQFPEKLVPLMIRNALAGEALPVYGDGTNVRDWLYVEDTCGAVLRVLEEGQPGGVYNVAAAELHSNLDVVHAICRILAAEAGMDQEHLRGRIRFVPDRPGHDRCYRIDDRRVRRLGWLPRVRFEDGLRRTVRWYLQHRDWLEQATSGEYAAYYRAVYVRQWDQAEH